MADWSVPGVIMAPMHALLAQTETALETADKVAGLPAAALLALACGALVWKLLKTEAQLEKAQLEADEQRDARIEDLKQTIKDLGGAHKESA